MTVLEGIGSLLRAVAGMFIVLGVWAAVQGLARRRSGCKNPDKDLLDYMLHGCGGECGGKDGCHSSQPAGRIDGIETKGIRGAR